MKINIDIRTSLFGKIKRIRFYYLFKKDLEEVYHDEFFSKCDEIFGKQDSCLELGRLGFEYLEADIFDKELLNNINVGIINDNCNRFAELISGLINEYEL